MHVITILLDITIITFSSYAGKKLELQEYENNSDWNQSRKRHFKRTQLLNILLVIKDVMPKVPVGEQISRQTWQQELNDLKTIGFPDASSVQNIPWQTVRSVIKAMVVKYQKDPESKSYKTFLNLARTMWRQSLEEL